MTPPEPSGNIAFRLTIVERENVRRDERIEKAEDLAAKHELELHGERGVYVALRELANEIKWTRRAMWALAGSLIITSITIAAAVIQ